MPLQPFMPIFVFNNDLFRILIIQLLSIGRPSPISHPYFFQATDCSAKIDVRLFVVVAAAAAAAVALCVFVWLVCVCACACACVCAAFVCVAFVLNATRHRM